MIFLPGTDKQLKFLTELIDISGKKILIAGGGTLDIAFHMIKLDASGIQVITNDNSELTEMRYKLKTRDISVKLMEFDNTDYQSDTFDIIYSQGTFSTRGRRKIYKEMKNLLKQDGIICAGEVISTTADVSRFLKDIWEASGLQPLTIDMQKQFYSESGLDIIEQKDLSFTLREFYETGKQKLMEFEKEVSEDEKKFYKKLLNKISHESNAYLRLGGNKLMEFHVFLLKRRN